MLISGLKKRSIADQSGVVEFQFNVTAQDNTGSTFVGLSGTNKFGFNLQNSKIYDPNGKFVGSYDKNVPVLISGQVGQSSFDYYIDNELIAMESPCTSGTYSWLVAQSSTAIDFEGFIKGKTTDFTVESTGKYYYQDFVVTGRIINKDSAQKFRIFDVQLNQGSSPYSIQGFSTGDIYGTGYLYLTSNEIGLSDSVVPLTVNTNFGDLNIYFLVSGDYTVVPDVFLNISPDTTNVLSNVSKHYNVQISNFPSGTQIGVSLSYESGITGNIYFFEEVVSPLTGFITGDLIVGAQTLRSFQYGIVSGLDPKTNIVETGLASGLLVSPVIYATGDVIYDYSITGYGFGQGALNINYFVSGQTTGFYNGIIPIAGGFLPATTYNFHATGDTPGTGTGIAPTGYGLVWANPTGCVSTDAPLVITSDFYRGIVYVEKAFTGQLVIPYNIVCVGWATGDTFSGIVSTSFPRIFDLGEYNFTKFFSGMISGSTTNTGMFNPRICLNEHPASSGVISGYFTTSSLLDCDVLTGGLTIGISGKPLQVYGENMVLLEPNTVVSVYPSGGFGALETSYDYLLGDTITQSGIRTRTSRMGATPSGSGYFHQVVGLCTSAGSITNATESATDFYNNMWKENINTVVTSGQFDSNNNYLGRAAFDVYLTGYGRKYDTSTSGSPQDSGLLHFIISGEGKKTIALRGLYPFTSPVPDTVLEFFLYKNGGPTDIWGTQGTNANASYTSSTPWQKWRTIVAEGIDPADTIVVLEDLTSGSYSLYAYAQQVAAPVIGFTQKTFSGCESSSNLQFSVAVKGTMLSDVWVEMKQYIEYTAHSGVNYDPIFFAYTEDGARDVTGNRRNGHIGLYFPAASQNYSDGTGYQEITLSLPIYDNAAYGDDHEFYVRLSNASGARLVNAGYDDGGGEPFNSLEPTQILDTALFRIIENDDKSLVTGTYVQAMPVVPWLGDNASFTTPDSGLNLTDSFYHTTDLSHVGDLDSIDTFSTQGVDYGIVLTSGLMTTSYRFFDNPFFCEFVSPVEPPTAPECYPDCIGVGQVGGGPLVNSHCTGRCDAETKDCCACSNTTTTTLNCPGYGTIPVTYLASGAKCAQGTDTGSCDTDCYRYVGSVCMGMGTVFNETFSTTHDTFGRTDCTCQSLLIDSPCVAAIDDSGKGKCPEDGGCMGSVPTTPGALTTECVDGKLVNIINETGGTLTAKDCPNIASSQGSRKKPASNPCPSKLLFIKVTCPHDSDEEAGFCTTCYPDDIGGGNTSCPGGSPCTTSDMLPGRSCGFSCFVCLHNWTYNWWTSPIKGQTPQCPPPK